MSGCRYDVNSTAGGVIVFLFLVLMLGGVAYGIYRKLAGLAPWRRRRLLLGTNFVPSDGVGIAPRLSWWDAFPEGTTLSVHNAMEGACRGHKVVVFDLEARSARDNEEEDVSNLSAIAAIGREAMSFPRLAIKPIDMARKLSGETVGNIGFESAEFSRSFLVKSEDRKFAYDVVSPPMMEFLLANRGWNIDLGPGAIIVSTGRMWTLKDSGLALDFLTGFLDLIPRYIWKDLGETAEAERSGREAD